MTVVRQVPYRQFLPEEEGGEPIASFAYALLDGVAKARGCKTATRCGFVCVCA